MGQGDKSAWPNISFINTVAGGLLLIELKVVECVADGRKDRLFVFVAIGIG